MVRTVTLSGYHCRADFFPSVDVTSRGFHRTFFTMTSSDTQAIATLQTHTAPSRRQGNDVTNEEFPPNLPGRPQLKNQPLNNECCSKLLPLLPHTLPTAETGVTSPRHQTNAPPVRGSTPKSLLPHQTAPSCTTSPNQQKVLPKIPATLQKQWAPNVRSPLQKQGAPNERSPMQGGAACFERIAQCLGDAKPHTTTPPRHRRAHKECASAAEGRHRPRNVRRP